MKLSAISTEERLPEFDHFTLSFSNKPFWNLYVLPNRNPYGLFSFTVMKIRDNGSGYRCGMYKTSYYQNWVIQKRFDSDCTIQDIINWVTVVLSRIKIEL